MNIQFRIAIRSIIKNKSIFFIKVFSFIILFIFSVFVLGWVRFEKNYDKWTAHYDRVYRFTMFDNNSNEGEEFAFIAWKSWIKELPEFFPEIDEMVRLEQQQGNISIRCEDKMFYSRNLFGADSNVFNVFNVKFLNGESNLNKPHTAVISRSLAEKYFGTTNCQNKIIECALVWDTAYISYTINGVFEDFPAQSHFHPEIFISFDKSEEYARRNYVYLKLSKNAGPENILNRFDEFKKLYCDLNPDDDFVPHLQSLTDIHLYSKKARELEPSGNSIVLNIMLISIIVLLIIVLINYTNLQIGLYSRVTKFFFIQKTFGNRQKEQVKYLFFNSIIVITFGFLISLIVFKPAALLFQNYLNIVFRLPDLQVVASFVKIYFFIVAVVFIIDYFIVHFVDNTQQFVKHAFAGFKPGNYGMQKSKTRIILIITQATITICLIISAIVSVRQIDLMAKNRLGHGKSNIINLKKLPRKAVENYEIFKEKLIQHAAIIDVTSSMEEPSGQTNDKSSYTFNGKKYPNNRIFILPVDHNFNSFYENQIFLGEDLSYVPNRKSSEKYLINETAMRYLGYNDPKDVIGKSFQYHLDYEGLFFPGYISGVVKDFHLSTMEETVKPLALYYLTFFNYSFSVKVEPSALFSGIEALSETWKELFPEFPLEYFFIDELYNNLYSQFILQSKFINLLLIVILIITNIGLLAVVSLQIKQKTKEIGIRKVNGAKIWEILAMLNIDFLKWIVAAFVVATPLGWYAMHKWLENFAYKTELSWWVFALAGVLAIGIALLTVSFQSYKAAIRNPVESLKYE